MSKKIVIIETDQAFIQRLTWIFESIGNRNDYELLYPSLVNLSSKSEEDIVDFFVKETTILINSNREMIVGVLVDIRLMEDSNDILGVKIAYSIKALFPFIPVINITNHYKGDDIQLFGELTLGEVDGVLSKSYFTSENFTMKKLNNIFYLTQNKIIARNAQPEKAAIPSPQIDKKPLVDIAIITALSKIEFDAFKESYKIKPIPSTSLMFPDTSTYFQGTVTIKGKTVNIVAATDDKMGMPATTSLATRIIQQFNPKFIVILGICAGLEGPTNIGDIILAEFCWDYGSGKRSIVEDENNNKIEKFSPYNKHYPLDERLRKDAINLENTAKIMAGIKSKSANYQGNLLELNFHIGPFASGAAVIADKNIVTEIKTHEGKLIGFDMESYGVFYAANNLNDYTKAISIKGVSDFGTEQKDTHLKDSHQKYAAKNSVLFFKFFLEKILIKYL